jgi:hypothetical protein
MIDHRMMTQDSLDAARRRHDIGVADMSGHPSFDADELADALLDHADWASEELCRLRKRVEELKKDNSDLRRWRRIVDGFSKERDEPRQTAPGASPTSPMRRETFFERAVYAVLMSSLVVAVLVALAVDWLGYSVAATLGWAFLLGVGWAAATGYSTARLLWWGDHIEYWRAAMKPTDPKQDLSTRHDNGRAGSRHGTRTG